MGSVGGGRPGTSTFGTDGMVTGVSTGSGADRRSSAHMFAPIRFSRLIESTDGIKMGYREINITKLSCVIAH